MTPTRIGPTVSIACLLIAATASACQAQDTTAIKALSARTKLDMDSVYTATRMSTSQVNRNNRAEVRVRARQDSIVAAMRRVPAPPDTTTPPPADTTTYIDILPGASIQAAVDAAPAGTKFRLKAGTHVRQDVRPKAGNVFRGEGNLASIMDGQNVSTFAFRGYNGSAWVNNVKLVNIAITRYAPPAQNGAIWGGDDVASNTSTSGWVLDSLDVHHNANIGIRIGHRMQVLRSQVRYNGTAGIGGIGQTVLIDGLSSTYNNNGCPNNPGFESGGSKFVYTDSLVVRNSTFSFNCGPGLWLDIMNKRYSLHDNTVAQNYREGIVVEVSQGGFNAGLNKIYNNTITGTGVPVDPFRPNGWLWDAGIGIHASDSVEVYNNTLSENYNGIVIIQQPRNPSVGDPYCPVGGCIARNVYVHNNTITQRNGGSSGGVTDTGDNAVFTTRSNTWANNTYYLGTNSAPFAWSNGYRTCTEWKGFGMDTAGTCNP